MSDLLETVRKINANNGIETDAEPTPLITPMFCVNLDRDLDTFRVLVICAKTDDPDATANVYVHEHTFNTFDECAELRDKVRRFANVEYAPEWIAMVAYLEESPHWRAGRWSPTDWHRRQRRRIAEREERRLAGTSTADKGGSVFAA